MKNLFIVVLVLVMASISGSAIANGGGIEVEDNNVAIGSTGIQGDKNHHNVIVGEANIGTNAGGSIVNKNSNKNTNTNVNVNLNKNENKNVNKNTNIQGQGQMQGQMQGQGQKQNMSFNQKFEDTRDHVNPAQPLTSDAKLADRNSFDHKTVGSVWERVRELTTAQAKKLATDTTDVEIDDAVIFEHKNSITSIKRGRRGDFIGYLYVTPTGEHSALAGMEGVAALRAMELGATHMRKYYADSGTEASGSAWNIGLGGGASLMKGSNDSIAIAPNGGLGFGSAKASNDERPALVFELFFDEDSIEKDDDKKDGDKKPAPNSNCNFTDFDTVKDWLDCKDAE